MQERLAVSQNGCLLVCVMVGLCFYSSSAPCSAQPQTSLSHLMKKRVDLLEITDAENRLTQLGCTFSISCSPKNISSNKWRKGGKHKRDQSMHPIAGTVYR